MSFVCLDKELEMEILMGIYQLISLVLNRGSAK